MKRKTLFFIVLLSLILTLLQDNYCYSQNTLRIDSLKYLLGKENPDTIVINLNLLISDEYLNVDLPKAFQYAEEAVKIAGNSGNQDRVLYTEYKLGMVYYHQGLYDPALKKIYPYLERLKEKGNTKRVVVCLNNVGAIYLDMSEFKNAKQIFLEILETISKLKSANPSVDYVKEMLSAYGNLGVACLNMKESALAIEYFKKGIELARKNKNQETLLANLLNNLGSAYYESNQLDLALDPILESYSIRLKQGDLRSLARSQRNLAIYYTKSGDLANARIHLYEGLALATTCGDISLQTNFTEKLFLYYQKTGNTDSALRYHISLKDLMDKMNIEEARSELTRLELTMQFREKEKLNQIEQKRKEFRYMIIGIGMLLFLTVISLLYMLSQNRLKRLKLEKDNSDLVSRNLELNRQSLENELELRNKELTTNVMFQIQKNELVQEIIGKLITHNRNTNSLDSKAVYGIIKDLEKTLDSSAWSEFEVRFNQVHNEFYAKLNSINSELSTNERRLCAFLRLNMTTKEIASITGQTIRSIEVARTRLRKKLNLTNSDSGLTEFLATI